MQHAIIRSEDHSRPAKGRTMFPIKNDGGRSAAVDFSTTSVLVVDDQELLREAIAFEFEMLGCMTHQAANGEEALKSFQKTNPSVIISDIRMPVWDGVKLLAEVRRIAKQTPPFILMSGYSDLLLSQAYQLGADTFLQKPLYPDSLEETLRRVLTPLEKRWRTLPKGLPSFKVAAQYGSLAEAMLQKDMMVGRSGLFLGQSLLPKDHVVACDQLVAFHLAFKEGPFSLLEGVGRVRWVNQDPNSGPIGVGIEHEFLAPSGRDGLTRYVRDHQIIPVIPDGSVQG